MTKPPSASLRARLLEQALYEISTDLQKWMYKVVTTQNEEGDVRFMIQSSGNTHLMIDVPLRGEDGGYVITIPGDPKHWLSQNIDVIAYQYGFHRISNIEKPVSMTQEWLENSPESKAISTLSFLMVLLKKMNSF